MVPFSLMSGIVGCIPSATLRIQPETCYRNGGVDNAT